MFCICAYNKSKVCTHETFKKKKNYTAGRETEKWFLLINIYLGTYLIVCNKIKCQTIVCCVNGFFIYKIVFFSFFIPSFGFRFLSCLYFAFDERNTFLGFILFFVQCEACSIFLLCKFILQLHLHDMILFLSIITKT